VVDALVTKTAEAAAEFGAAEVLGAGGVAANRLLREQMVARLGVPVRFPPIRFCTDNAAMVGAVGYYRYLAERAPIWR
jgi:N6-L-threonylcarbamoyladenine synthase